MHIQNYFSLASKSSNKGTGTKKPSHTVKKNRNSVIKCNRMFTKMRYFGGKKKNLRHSALRVHSILKADQNITLVFLMPIRIRPGGPLLLVSQKNITRYGRKLVISALVLWKCLSTFFSIKHFSIIWAEARGSIYLGSVSFSGA
jgi:hypothetical protein